MLAALVSWDVRFVYKNSTVEEGKQEKGGVRGIEIAISELVARAPFSFLSDF